MEVSSLPPSHKTAAAWQLLGEFELTLLPQEDTLHAWLQELLTPLHLHDELSGQLWNSAQEVTTRALNYNSETPFKHIHLCVFAPKVRDPQRNTWGFFRIEKIDSAKQAEDHPEYVVEFYLYLEG